MTTLAPIPIGTKSHLQSLFDKLYESYSRDPVPESVITWSVDPGVGSAYLKIIGMTATLVMTDISDNVLEQNFNLVNDGNGNKPTLLNFKDWLESSLSGFFTSDFTVAWEPRFADLIFSDDFQRVDNPTNWNGSWVPGVFNDSLSISFTVSGHKGIITTLNNFSQGYNDLGSHIYPDHEQLVRIILNGSALTTGGLTQRNNDGDTFYLGRLTGVPGPDPLILAIDYAVPADNELITGVSIAGSAFGVAVWVRFRVEGHHLSIKGWIDGDPEPDNWTLEADDTHVSLANGTGVYGFGTDIGDNVEFDYYTDTVLNIPEKSKARSISALSLIEGYVTAG